MGECESIKDNFLTELSVQTASLSISRRRALSS